MDDAPYPSCVCPEGLSTNNDKISCSNGTCRLTESTIQDDLYILPKALQHGIKFSTLMYGFWPTRLGEYLTIKLEKPSIVSVLKGDTK